MLGFGAIGRFALGELPHPLHGTYVLTASPASFTLTGKAATRAIGRLTSRATFLLTGKDARLIASNLNTLVLTAAVATFHVTGGTAFFAKVVSKTATYAAPVLRKIRRAIPLLSD